MDSVATSKAETLGVAVDVTLIMHNEPRSAEY